MFQFHRPLKQAAVDEWVNEGYHKNASPRLPVRGLPHLLKDRGTSSQRHAEILVVQIMK
jgi:hypothetical protein